MALEAELREALAAVDQALAERPHKEGHTFSAAARHLCAIRDALLDQAPSDGRRRQLDHVNAVISVVLAGHFPLGAVPWRELELARGWLAELSAGEGFPLRGHSTCLKPDRRNL